MPPLFSILTKVKLVLNDVKFGGKKCTMIALRQHLESGELLLLTSTFVVVTFRKDPELPFWSFWIYVGSCRYINFNYMKSEVALVQNYDRNVGMLVIQMESIYLARKLLFELFSFLDEHCT